MALESFWLGVRFPDTTASLGVLSATVLELARGNLALNSCSVSRMLLLVESGFPGVDGEKTSAKFLG